MSFIYTDTMLPLFFCIFIQTLPTSDWNANDFIAKSVEFELFHFKMPMENRLFVNPHCVVRKYIIFNNVSVFFTAEVDYNCYFTVSPE